MWSSLMFGMVLTTGLLDPATSLTQEAEGGYDPHEYLKSAEWLDGEWTGKFTPPGGQTRTEQRAYHWIYCNKFRRIDIEILAAGQLVRSSEVTTYWDPEERVARVLALSSDGAVVKGKIEAIDGGFRIPYEGITGDGKDVSMTYILKRTGEETMKSQRVNIIIGGKPQPDGPTIEFRRETAND